MQSRRRQKSSSSSDLLGVRNDTNHVSRSNNYENIISSTTESALSDIAESRNPGQSSQHGLEASVVDDRINASGRMTKILFVIFSLLSVFGVVMWLVQLRHNSTIISATAPNTMPSVSIPRGKSISGNFENRLDEYCSAKMPHERLQARPNAAPGGHLRTQWSSLIEPSPLVIGNWTLVYLAINIRHGDRSAIEAFPGAAAVSTEKDLYGSRIPFLLNDQAPLYLKYLQSFQLKRIYKDQHASTESNAGNLKGEDLSRALDPMSVFSTSDVLLPKGQLTSIGFMQHITLGSLLRTQYQQLLERVVSNDQLYVRSTNYRRTIQSVAALLTTLLPQLAERSDPELHEKVPILTYEYEEDEIMHGIGARSSSHSMQLGQNGLMQEVELSGGCAKAVALAAQQKKSFEPNQDLLEKLMRNFGNKVNAKTAPELVDASIIHMCHHQALPCPSNHHTASESTTADANADASLHAGDSLRADSSPDSQHSLAAVKSKHTSSKYSAEDYYFRGYLRQYSEDAAAGKRNETCFSPQDLQLLMEDADRFYCGRFGGGNGGLAATKLALFPFLQEIVGRLANAAISNAQYGERVAVYSGHDTVIAPVLASLGVYEGSLCAWPPYASRIVFELWHARETAAGADLASPREMKLQGRQFGWKPDLLGPSIVSLSGFPQQPSQREVLSYLKSFVRVVFNGMDITQQIPACRAERKEASLGATDGTEEQPLGSVGTLRMTYVKDVINSKLSLCSLEGLIRQVRSNLGPHDTVAHACDMHQQ